MYSTDTPYLYNLCITQQPICEKRGRIYARISWSNIHTHTTTNWAQILYTMHFSECGTEGIPPLFFTTTFPRGPVFRFLSLAYGISPDNVNSHIEWAAEMRHTKGNIFWVRYREYESIIRRQQNLSILRVSVGAGSVRTLVPSAQSLHFRPLVFDIDKGSHTDEQQHIQDVLGVPICNLLGGNDNTGQTVNIFIGNILARIGMDHAVGNSDTMNVLTSCSCNKALCGACAPFIWLSVLRVVLLTSVLRGTYLVPAFIPFFSGKKGVHLWCIAGRSCCTFSDRTVNDIAELGDMDLGMVMHKFIFVLSCVMIDFLPHRPNSLIIDVLWTLIMHHHEYHGNALEFTNSEILSGNFVAGVLADIFFRDKEHECTCLSVVQSLFRTLLLDRADRAVTCSPTHLLRCPFTPHQNTKKLALPLVWHPPDGMDVCMYITHTYDLCLSGENTIKTRMIQSPTDRSGAVLAHYDDLLEITRNVMPLYFAGERFVTLAKMPSSDISEQTINQSAADLCQVMQRIHGHKVCW